MSDFRSVIRAHLNRLSPRKADKLTLADGRTVDIPESWYNGIENGDFWVTYTDALDVPKEDKPKAQDITPGVYRTRDGRIARVTTMSVTGRPQGYVEGDPTAHCWMRYGTTGGDNPGLDLVGRIEELKHEEPKAQEPAVSDAALAKTSARERGGWEWWCASHGLVLRTRQEWEERGKESRDAAAYDLFHEFAALTERCKAAEQENERLTQELKAQAWRTEVADAVIDQLRARIERMAPSFPGSQRNTSALLTRSPDLEHRLGFGDAGKER